MKYGLFEISGKKWTIEELIRMSTDGQFSLGGDYKKLRRQFSFRSYPAEERIEFLEFIKKVGCSVCALSDGLQRHHARPLSRGGTNHPDNIVLLCEKCHEQVHGFEFKKPVKKIKLKKKPMYLRPQKQRDPICGHGVLRKWCTACRYVKNAYYR